MSKTPVAETEVTDDLVAQVGVRLRAIRRARRLSLRVVADRADISESFLSLVERGRSGVNIATLQRIALALGIPVSELFATDVGPRVLRRAVRPALELGGMVGRKYLLTPKSALNVEVLVGELGPGGSTGPQPYAHGASEELFVVLSGRVQCAVGDTVYVMEAGDSIFYSSSDLHRAENLGADVAEVMWIIAPPTS